MKEFSDDGSEAEPMKQRQARFNRTIRALFKKSFLIKTRRPMSIVEFCIATLLWIVLYPCYTVASKNHKGDPHPRAPLLRTIPSRLCVYFTTQANTTFSIAPDCENTRNLSDLLNRSMLLSLAIMAFERLNKQNNTNSSLNMTTKMNYFVDGYSNAILKDVQNSFSGIINIDFSNSYFESYVKKTVIEGVLNFYQDETRKFNFSKFVKENILKYFNSVFSFKKNGEMVQFSENSYLKEFEKHFESTTSEVLQKSYMTKYADEGSKNVLAPNDLFPGSDINISDFEMNQTLELVREFYNYNPIFVENGDQVRDKIYDRSTNGLGIYWVNANNSNNATRSPEVQTFYQNFDDNPGESMFDIIMRSISYMNGYVGYKYDFVREYYQEYPYPDFKRTYDISILVAIIVVFPIVIASMSDLQILLEEKDNHVMVLSFLMGCTETAYFLVIFCMLFLSSIFGYILMCIFYCFVFIFKGTSFTLMLFISFLFIISHISFMMFLTTFMKKAATGRVITLLFLIIAVFFAFVHFFYTLDESNNSNVAKHIFSIVPLSCYEMAMISMFKECLEKLPPVGWSMLKNNSHVKLVYQMWFALMWLSIDFVVYTLLFIIFNLTNPRDFGSPPIKWKDLFKKRSWKRLLSHRKPLSLVKKGTSMMYDTNTNLFDNELIKVENLSKVYHGHKTVTAISNVNFTIFQNEVIVVIGPNGAGKSTLINILSGSLQPTTGKLSLYKEPPTESFNEIKNILGVCFQDNVIIEMLSIEENLKLFAAFRNIPKDELKRTMTLFAETLQLKEMMKTRTGDLSGGQKRKVCIALSLLGNPPLVIMDEPTAGVDVQARQLIWKFIASLKNTTAIITSHALEEAEAVSSRLFVVAGGTLPFAGTSTEFRKTFKCGYILRIESSKSNQDNQTNQNNQNNQTNQDNQTNQNNQNSNNESALFVENGEDHVQNQNPEVKAKESAENHKKKLFRRRKKKKDPALNKMFDSVHGDSDDGLPDVERLPTEDEKATLKVLELARSYEPKAKLSRERSDSIWLPVSQNMPTIINEIEKRKDELCVKSYSISVEQLEDVLLKLIMTEETSFNRSSYQP